MTFTTFETGQTVDPDCGALPTMSADDTLVSIIEGTPRSPAAHCLRGAHVVHDPWALIVLGPEVPGAVRDEANAIVERVRRPA